MPPSTSSDAEGFRRRIVAFRKPLGPLLKARISAFRPVLRFTDFNGHIACGHERGHGRSISRGNKRSGGGHSAQCRGSWLPSVLHAPVALWGSNQRSEAKAAKIICQLHPPPRPTCVWSPTVRRWPNEQQKWVKTAAMPIRPRAPCTEGGGESGPARQRAR